MGMEIKFVEQHLVFVFEVLGQAFKVSFERHRPQGQWDARLLVVEQNQVAYSSQLDSSVVPDMELAEEMVRTYVSRGDVLH